MTYLAHYSDTYIRRNSVPNWLSLPGSTGQHASTPDAATLDITGDIDVRVKVALPDWSPSSVQYLLGKWLAGAGQASYNFSVSSTGTLNFAWSANGSATLSATSNATVPFSDGAAGWVRATLDVDNGASGRTVRFYTSTDGSTWTEVGTAQTTAGVTSIFASTTILYVGALNNSVAGAAGDYYEVQVLNGIDGTVVADFNADDFDIGEAAGATAVDSTGKTWTLTGAGVEIEGVVPSGTPVVSRGQLLVTG